MIEMIRDLLRHKGHADAALLQAITAAGATADAELRTLLDHMLVSNRFWLLAVLDRSFDAEAEARPSGTFQQLVQRLRDVHDEELAWIAAASDAHLQRTLQNPFIPGGRCSVGEGLLQVCLHSQGHRAQAAKMLRRSGGAPPLTDYIVWRLERPDAAWPA